jgi:4-amino-4-deoxy-L-arabinose transferase-like glycosyltransferase
VRVRLTLPLLLTGVAVAYGLSSAALPLGRAEALYALIPREMLASGDWLTPTLQGVPYLDKPPLLYWLNAALFAWLGLREETLRLLNLLVALGEVWLTWRLGRELLPERAARWGAGVLAASLGFYVLHLQLLPDHLITFFLLGALFFWLHWLAGPTRLTAAGFFLCLAGGLMSKGGIGLLFPVAIVALTAPAAGRREGLRLLLSPCGCLLAALPLAVWLLLLESRHPGTAWHLLVNEQILRFLGAREPLDLQGFSLPGFWLLTGLWLLPWTPLLPAALVQGWRAAADSGPPKLSGCLLLLWPAVILGFYSLSGCRVEYYPLPALPGLALLVGWRLDRGLALPRDRALAMTLLVLAGLAVLSGVALPALEAMLAANRREFAGLAAALGPLVPGATLTLAGLAVGGAWAGRRRPHAAAVCLGAVALLLGGISFQALRSLSPLLGDQLPGAWLKNHARPEELVILDTVEEYEYAASLVWYAGRRVSIVVRDGLPRYPRPVAREADHLLSPEQLQRLWEGPGRVWVLVDASAVPREPWRRACPAAVFPGRRLFVNRAPLPGLPEKLPQKGKKTII